MADSHEVEVAIRRYEGDGPVVLKARQPDTLVKLDVLQIHRLVLRAAPLVVKQHLRQTDDDSTLSLQEEVALKVFQAGDCTACPVSGHLRPRRRRLKELSARAATIDAWCPSLTNRLHCTQSSRYICMAQDVAELLPQQAIRLAPPHMMGLGLEVEEGLTLSLSPSLHSGMPERKVLILRAPMTSDLTTDPLLLTSRFTLSTTSKNTSFFLYRIPSLRHDTALVTAIGGRACTCAV